MTGQPDNILHLEPWVGKKEMAAHLGCGVRWLEYKLEAGMPHAIIAGRVKMRVSEVEPWLEARGFMERRGGEAA